MSFFHNSVSRLILTEVRVTARSSSLQDPSQYSGQSQKCCSVDGLHSFSYFQVLQSLYLSFSDCSKSTNCNWYNCHFNVPQFFQLPCVVKVLIFLFAFFFNFTLWSANTATPAIIIIIIIKRSDGLAEIRRSVCISKS